MLTKDELIQVGYEIMEDPREPGKFCIRKDDEDYSILSYVSEEEAIAAATNDAIKSYNLSRCQNCDNIYDEQNLVTPEHLSERVAPGEPMPSGECPDCGALCHTIPKDGDMVTLPRSLLRFLLDMSGSHVEDIESGLEEGLYDLQDNQDLHDKQAAISKIEQILAN